MVTNGHRQTRFLWFDMLRGFRAVLVLGTVLALSECLTAFYLHNKAMLFNTSVSKAKHTVETKSLMITPKKGGKSNIILMCRLKENIVYV